MYRERSRPVFLVLILLVVLSVSCLYRQEEGEILVSAALSLKDAFKEMGSVYEQQTGRRVRFSFGASGLLQKQIEAGAPVDVYASAGMKQMDALQTGGFIVTESRRSFARNSLVLVVSSRASQPLRSFKDLLGPGITRLAIGNPKTVPAGQYAQQALKSLSLWNQLESRLLPAENVRQVLDYVVREEVDAGIVYASEVPISRGKAVIAASAPVGSHNPILYPIAVVKDAKSPTGAQKFINLALSDSGQTIMGKYGFLPVR